MPAVDVITDLGHDTPADAPADVAPDLGFDGPADVAPDLGVDASADGGDRGDTNDGASGVDAFGDGPPADQVAIDAGAVDVPIGAFHPTANTILPSGVHRFTEVHVPVGVMVTTTPPGVLEILATGPIRVEGTIDLSGESGSPGGEIFQHEDRQSISRGRGGWTGVGASGGSFDPPGGGRRMPAGGSGVASASEPQGRYPATPGDGPAGGAAGEARDMYSFPSCSGLPTTPCGVPTGGQAGGAPYDGAPGGRANRCDVCEWQGLPGIAGALAGGGGGSIGMAARNDLAVRDTFFAGSGGGGGGGERSSGGGGGGGGALRLQSAVSLSLGPRARVLARGGSGACGGGGGSGGVIVLTAPAVNILAGATVDARGGEGTPTGPCHFSDSLGGDGGLGRVRIAVDPARCVLMGDFVPPLVDGCMQTAGSGTLGRSYIGPWSP